MHQQPPQFLIIERGLPNLQQVLDALPPGARVQSLESPITAAARIGGGGISVVIFHSSSAAALASSLGSLPDPLTMVELGPEAPASPSATFVRTDAGWPERLRNCLVASAVGTEVRTFKKSFAFIGAKGGCGTTTIALSVAHQLSCNHEVVLAAAAPAFGGLRAFLNPPAAIPDTQLWQARHSQRLRIAFNGTACHGSRGDYLVWDVNNQSEPAFTLDYAVVVAERERIATVAGAQRVREVLQSGAARAVGAVIVNKVAYAAPIPLPEIERQLGVDVLAVLPPAADLCAAAVKQLQPVVSYDRDSSLARALAALAERLA